MGDRQAGQLRVPEQPGRAAVGAAPFGGADLPPAIPTETRLGCSARRLHDSIRFRLWVSFGRPTLQNSRIGRRPAISLETANFQQVRSFQAVNWPFEKQHFIYYHGLLCG
jgi:hypothetical protein